jgi:hypothetical protein
MATVDGQSDGALLFVHGIGEQEHGSTLEIWSPRLLKYLQTIAGDNAVRMKSGLTDQSRPILVDVSVTAHGPNAPSIFPAGPSAPEPERPGDGKHYESWTLRGRTESSTAERHWLVTESCWAKSFELPSMWRVRLWAVLIFARFFLYHWAASLQYPAAVASSQRLSIKQPGQIVPATLKRYIFGWLALLVVLPRAIALGFSFWQLVGDLRMPDLIGDSLAAVGDARARKSMLARIEGDLTWCLSNVDEESGIVIIVAHSQGAMLVRELLDQPDRTDYVNRVRLITVGSGIAPLHSLRDAQKLGAVAWSWVSLAALVLFAVSGLLVVWSMAEAQGVGPWGLVALPVLAAVGAYAARRGGISDILPSLRHLPLDGKVKGWSMCPAGTTRSLVDHCFMGAT